MATNIKDNSQLPHIWFCGTCRRKGRMSNLDSANLKKALKEHKFATPNCLGDVRYVLTSEAENVSGIGLYTDWYE